MKGSKKASRKEQRQQQGRQQGQPQQGQQPVERKKRKKVTVPKKAIAAILVLIGIGVLAISLGYLRPSLVEQGEDLQAQNDSLKAQMTQLNELVANEASYQQQTEQFQADNQVILDQYPANVLEEDAILYAKEIEDESDYWIDLVSLVPNNLLYQTGMAAADDTTADTTTTDDDSLEEDTTTSTDTTDTTGTATDTSAGDSGYDLGILDASSVAVPDYQLYDMSATYEFTTSYEYLKKIIEKVQTDPEHRNVGSLSVERDNTGELVGTMTLNLYSLTGTEKVYETPDAGSIKKGRDDLFGALQSSKTEDTTANKNTKKSTKKK